MSLGNLTTQRQADSRTFGLCGKKWHEKVRRIHNPGTFVLNENLDRILFLAPPDQNFAVCFKRSINSVMHKIDQCLFDLRSVGTNDRFRTWYSLYIEPWFQVHDTLNQLPEIDSLFLRRRK